MTAAEKERHRDDVKAAEQNLRDVIARSVPRGSRRRKAIDYVRLARSHAVKGIEEQPA